MTIAKMRAATRLLAVPCLVAALVVALGTGGAAASSSGLTLQRVTVDYPSSHWSPTWTYNTPDPGGTATWDTSTTTGTYSFPIPQTIPADGVTITLSVTAETKSSAPHNTSFVPAEGITSSLVPGGYAAVNTTACGDCDPGYKTANPNTGTKKVTLTPTGSSPVTLSVGLQDGPTFTYTYKAKSAPKRCIKPRDGFAAAAGDGPVAHAACGDDDSIWAGTWVVGNGKDTFGKMVIHAKKGDEHVTGTYDYSGGGTITGTVHSNGSVTKDELEGTFKDKAGHSGYFSVSLNGDLVSFDGYFKHCRSSFPCKHYKFHGEHQ